MCIRDSFISLANTKVDNNGTTLSSLPQIQENSIVVRDVVGATIQMMATPDSKRMTIESMKDEEKALKQYANDSMTRY